MYWKSSAARRLLPTPGSPTIVTSWQERCWAERSNVPISSAFSSSRPTSGVVCVRVTSEPKRARAASGRKRASGSALPFTVTGSSSLVVEHALRLAVRLLRDRDPVHRRRPLQAGSRVDDVARDDPLALLGAGAKRDDRLAGVDADAHLEGERGSAVVQLLDRLEDAEAGANGALGVVLVRDRRAEDGHHRVPDELLDRAAVALDLLPQARVVRADARADVLGVGGFRGRGEADEVAEEHGHDLALLLHRSCRLRGQRGRTERAERELAGELLTARRAGRHAPSLGTQPRRLTPGRATRLSPLRHGWPAQPCETSMATRVSMGGTGLEPATPSL